MAALKFEINNPTQVQLVYGNCFKKTHPQYGDDYGYTVNANGVEHKLYATPNLHSQIVELGAGKGSILEITKVEIGDNKKAFRVTEIAPPEYQGIEVRDGNSGQPIINGTAAAVAPAPDQAPQAPPAGESTQLASPDLQANSEHFLKALTASLAILRAAGEGRTDGELDFLYKTTYTLYKDSPKNPPPTQAPNATAPAPVAIAPSNDPPDYTEADDPGDQLPF